MNYDFPVQRTKLLEIVENASPDPANPSARNLGPGAVSIFIERLNENEEHRVEIVQKHGKVYPNPTKKKNTPYLRITAYCKLCQEQPKAKYEINITRKAFEASGNYVVTTAKRTGTHQHQPIARPAKRTVRKRNCKTQQHMDSDPEFISSDSSHDVVILSGSASDSPLEDISTIDTALDIFEVNVTTRKRITNNLPDVESESQDRDMTLVDFKPKITKEQRVEIAKEILLEYGGSAKSFQKDLR